MYDTAVGNEKDPFLKSRFSYPWLHSDPDPAFKDADPVPDPEF
jgi:hypothetical protein